MLDGIDVLVFDIQDVGARPYTYMSTLAYVMESAKQYGKEIWVLDRPNPIGGVRVEGPVLDPAFKSFIGSTRFPSGTDSRSANSRSSSTITSPSARSCAW